MLWLLALVGATVFIIGLFNWAESGAILWKIIKIKWRYRFRRLSPERRMEIENEIKELERSTDRYLLASLRIICLLAVMTWIFLAMTVVLRAMGINWLDSVSAQARSYWRGVSISKLHDNPSVDPNNRVTMRNDILQGMGNKLK